MPWHELQQRVDCGSGQPAPARGSAPEPAGVTQGLQELSCCSAGPEPEAAPCAPRSAVTAGFVPSRFGVCPALPGRTAGRTKGRRSRREVAGGHLLPRKC